MTPEQARDAIAASVAERDATHSAWDAALDRLHQRIQDVTGTLTPAELVELTGYSRERLRQIAHPEIAARGQRSRHGARK